MCISYDALGNRSLVAALKSFMFCRCCLGFRFRDDTSFLAFALCNVYSSGLAVLGFRVHAISCGELVARIILLMLPACRVFRGILRASMLESRVTLTFFRVVPEYQP